MTDSSNPRVSVIMGVYNAEPYLAAAIESILGQTFRDFEFIVVDDGSTDSSLQTLRRYAELDSRIRVRSWANAGHARALNEALSLASGEYIGRMDQDDISLPDRFERQVHFLDEHAECVAVGCRVLLIDPEGLPIRELCTLENHEDIDRFDLEDKRGTALAHPTLMMRRTVLIGIGAYRPDFELAEDVDLLLRLAEKGRLANMAEVLFHYRQHPGSSGYARSRKMWLANMAAVQDAMVRRGLPGTADSDSSTMKELARIHSQEQMETCHRKWAWWALGAGNVYTARKHAFAAFRQAPLSPESWRVLLCAIRGH